LIRALRGEGAASLDGAIERFRPFAADNNDSQYPDMLHGLIAWARLTAGDLESVVKLVVEYQFVDPTYGASALLLAGHAALWQRDLGEARQVQEVLRAFSVRGKWVDACPRSLAAGIAALEERGAEAVTLFSEAVQTLREDGVALDTMLCLMDQVAVLPPTQPAAKAAAEEARQIGRRLGAAALLQRLDLLLEAQAMVAPSAQKSLTR